MDAFEEQPDSAAAPAADLLAGGEPDAAADFLAGGEPDPTADFLAGDPDPAADFLAREQAELGEELGEELGISNGVSQVKKFLNPFCFACTLGLLPLHKAK
jgi:hypothetical protein